MGRTYACSLYICLLLACLAAAEGKLMTPPGAISTGSRSVLHDKGLDWQHEDAGTLNREDDVDSSAVGSASGEDAESIRLRLLAIDAEREQLRQRLGSLDSRPTTKEPTNDVGDVFLRLVRDLAPLAPDLAWELLSLVFIAAVLYLVAERAPARGWLAAKSAEHPCSMKPTVPVPRSKTAAVRERKESPRILPTAGVPVRTPLRPVSAPAEVAKPRATPSVQQVAAREAPPWTRRATANASDALSQPEVVAPAPAPSLPGPLGPPPGLGFDADDDITVVPPLDLLVDPDSEEADAALDASHPKEVHCELDSGEALLEPPQSCAADHAAQSANVGAAEAMHVASIASVTGTIQADASDVEELADAALQPADIKADPAQEPCCLDEQLPESRLEGVLDGMDEPACANPSPAENVVSQPSNSKQKAAKRKKAAKTISEVKPPTTLVLSGSEPELEPAPRDTPEPSVNLEATTSSIPSPETQVKRPFLRWLPRFSQSRSEADDDEFSTASQATLSRRHADGAAQASEKLGKRKGKQQRRIAPTKAGPELGRKSPSRSCFSYWPCSLPMTLAIAAMLFIVLAGKAFEPGVSTDEMRRDVAEKAEALAEKHKKLEELKARHSQVSLNLAQLELKKFEVDAAAALPSLVPERAAKVEESRADAAKLREALQELTEEEFPRVLESYKTVLAGWRRILTNAQRISGLPDSQTDAESATCPGPSECKMP